MTSADPALSGAQDASAEASQNADSCSDARDLASALAEIGRLQDIIAAGQRRERALINELQHRIRNMLSTIHSVYRQSMASDTDPAEFARHFPGRLDAIVRNQTYAGGVTSAGIEIEDMVRDELLHLNCLDGPRCRIAGPPVWLREKEAELMGLAIHELATNSVKFGALLQDGTLSIEWLVGSDALRFGWSERGVTIATSAPRRSGFGRQVIEEALPYQLDAKTSFHLRPGGIDCFIDLPLSDHIIVRGGSTVSEQEVASIPPLDPFGSP